MSGGILITQETLKAFQAYFGPENIRVTVKKAE